VVRRLGGYAAFDSSPPAIMFVAEPARMIVAPQKSCTDNACLMALAIFAPPWEEGSMGDNTE
jgi:hypothetical protein